MGTSDIRDSSKKELFDLVEERYVGRRKKRWIRNGGLRFK
jgi:hypothetical protein